MVSFMNKIKEIFKNIGPIRNAVRLIKKKIAIRGQKSRIRIIIKRLESEDKKYVLKNPSLLPLHKKLNKLRNKQIKNWRSYVYCEGYYYQGYNLIGINGIKPTEARIKNYGIDQFFTKTKSVLDIGANCGFLACHISNFVKEVDGIELNPFLVEMGQETKKFLSIKNVNFIQADFISYEFNRTYDIVFSLSNHYTIDGNLNLDFESYIKKIFKLLNSNGQMFFESHNVFGDDRDMDAKFLIASKYFKLIDYKMVKAFYSSIDIDKLFAVFVRLDEPGESQQFNFKLSDAISKYKY